MFLKAIKTTHYLLHALSEEDFESAKLEIEELQIVINNLEKISIKRESQQVLMGLVAEMKSKGLDIDFARSFLIDQSAKNAVENALNTEKRHKKIQGA